MKATAGNKFPKSARLLKHADFDRVYRQGRRHLGSHMSVFYLPQPQATGPRVGLTVGRAVGGAVTRNRIKRRMREAIRMHLEELSFAIDIVFNPRKSAAEAKFVDLESDVQRAFALVARNASKAQPGEKKQ